MKYRRDNFKRYFILTLCVDLAAEGKKPIAFNLITTRCRFGMKYISLNWKYS